MLNFKKDLAIRSEGSPSIKKFLRLVLFSPSYRTALFAFFIQKIFDKKLTKNFGYFLWQINSCFSGCHISPRAIVGDGVEFPHPLGVVIGDGVILGDCSIIYQGVTLGLKSRSSAGYPKIGERTIIYGGAFVVGDISVGSDCVIGANSFIAKNIEDGAKIGALEKLL